MINAALDPKQCARCSRIFTPSGTQNVYCSNNCRIIDYSRSQAAKHRARAVAHTSAKLKLARFGLNPVECKTKPEDTGKHRKPNCSNYERCVDACARADYRDFSCGECDRFESRIVDVVQIVSMRPVGVFDAL